MLAISDDPNQKPEIRRVERRSGHRTLRFRFEATTERLDRDRMLTQLIALGATFEGADRTLYALDIPPNQDYQAFCDQLWSWEESGLLVYETCEARVPGSFDGAPQDS